MAAVVLLRRTDDPWARSVGAYFALAGMVLVIRLVFQSVLGPGTGSTVLFTLPQVALPDWAAGIRLGGPVTAEALAYTAYDSLRLAVMLLCLGAANALANPKRALKAVPPALYEASVAVVIALSVAPQLVESTVRIRRAQRLRGGVASGWRAVPAVVVPVLGDAVDRSMSLAAAMEARGFGRTRTGASTSRLTTSGLLVASMLATVGGFLVLASPSAPGRLAGVACVAAGTAGVAWGLRVTGRRLSVSSYRPDPWTPRDTALIGCGLLALAGALWLAGSDYGTLNPSTDPLAWPSLHPLMALVLAGALGPLALVDAPERGRP